MRTVFIELFIIIIVFCADLYDCPVWKEFMGPLVRSGRKTFLTRMVLLVCFDFFLEFNQKTKEHDKFKCRRVNKPFSPPPHTHTPYKITMTQTTL